MISWPTILYGATLTAATTLTVVLLALRQRRPVVVAAVTASAGIGPIAWNAVLHTTHGTQFFTDAPIALFPASWQDTGSGITTVALTAIALGIGPLRNEPAKLASRLALAAGTTAFLIDVYLY